MEVLLKIAYILISLTIGIYLYCWSSLFKKIGSSTVEELNEGEEKDVYIINESEAKGFNYLGTITFIIIGILIWLFLGITIGKVASDITNHSILKWFVYFLMYFIFLRFPFGVGNRMVKRSYDFEHFPEKIFFSLTMIVSYIVSICCFEQLPYFLKWHLIFLN